VRPIADATVIRQELADMAAQGSCRGSPNTIRPRVRIAVVDTYYPAFLEEHYRSRPGLEQRPYLEQLAALMDRCFGTADAYSRHLNSLGHEAIDLVANCDPLQLRWAEEQSRPGRLRRRFARDRLQQIAMEQIDAHGAEVVYLQDLNFLSRSNLDRLREQGRLVAGQIASPMPDAEQLRGFSLLLTSFRHYVTRFRELGVDSEYLPIAFYAEVLDRLRADGVDPGPEADRPHAISFVGGLGADVHGPRVRLFEQIAESLPLEGWGYGWNGLPDDSPLRRAYRGEAWGLDMYRVLARSRIVVNVHSTAAEGYANNMRLFEATGTGALLVTEAAPNLADFFEPGREVVAYDGPDDLMAKLGHYLERDRERRAIASAGQRRTLRDHTYEQLMARLSDILEARSP
jgi:spore maturation protein CgeB